MILVPTAAVKNPKNAVLVRMTTSGSTDMQNAMNEVRRELEGGEFSTMEEAQVEIDTYMRRKNSAPVATFHGLSPEQMSRFLHFPFASPSLIQYEEDFQPPLDAPALTLFLLLAEAIGEKRFFC